MANSVFNTIKGQTQRAYGVAQEISKAGSPEAKFFLGFAALPASIIVKNVAQGALSICGLATIDVSSLRDLPMKILNVPSNVQRLLNNSIWSCAKPIFYGEFLQNYLFDKKLSSVLAKVAPKHSDFTKTKEGQISRVFLCSFLAGAMSFITCYSVNYKWNLKVIKWNKADPNPNFSLIEDHFAQAINEFINVFLICALRESTQSSLPGIGLEFIKSYS